MQCGERIVSDRRLGSPKAGDRHQEGAGVSIEVSKWHLYLVRTREGSLYTGIATDVARRFAEHQAGSDRGARYLRGRAPLQLVFKMEIGNRSLALRTERRVKNLPKAKKEQIVCSNPTARELMAQLGIEPLA